MDTAIVTTRLPLNLLERLDALLPALAQSEAVRMTGGHASRSTALRMALQRGLPLVEAELRSQKP